MNEAGLEVVREAAADGVKLKIIFPKLKAVFQEIGYACLPSIMWRFARNGVRCARRCPAGSSARPANMFVWHVRLTKQPITEPHTREDHRHVLRMMTMAEQILLFASYYPHWDFDDPRQVFRKSRMH